MPTSRDPWRVLVAVLWILAILGMTTLSTMTVARSIVEYVQTR